MKGRGLTVHHWENSPEILISVLRAVVATRRRAAQRPQWNRPSCCDLGLISVAKLVAHRKRLHRLERAPCGGGDQAGKVTTPVVGLLFQRVDVPFEVLFRTTLLPLETKMARFSCST